VPEDLDELYGRELKAIGRAAVPRSLERAHSALQPILRQEQRRAEKFVASGRSWNAPKFDSPFHRRRLKILNAVFLTLSRRGHSADAYESDGDIRATATIEHTRLGIVVGPAARQRRTGARISAALDWPAETPLAFSVDASFDGKLTRSWQDDPNGRIETKIAEIVARIIVAGEARFRRGLREAEEHAEECRRWQERQRREEIERRNAERLKHLWTSGELLRQAEDLRSLISRVRDAQSPVQQAWAKRHSAPGNSGLWLRLTGSIRSCRGRS